MSFAGLVNPTTIQLAKHNTKIKTIQQIKVRTFLYFKATELKIRIYIRFPTPF
jgi:hypothetical protein